MRAPVMAAVTAAHARPSTAVATRTITLPLRRPNFEIGIHLCCDPGFDGRGLCLRIVVRLGFFRRLHLRDLVNAPSDHLVHRPLAAVLRGELSRLECSLN